MSSFVSKNETKDTIIGEIVPYYDNIPDDYLALGQYFSSSQYPELAAITPDIIGGEYYLESSSPQQIQPAANPNIKCYANGKYLFNGYSGSGANSYLAYSSDGITWTTVYLGGDYSLLGIAYGNNIYVARGGSSGYIFWSSNLISWNSNATFTGSGIEFGNSIFVAPGTSGTTIYTSSNAISWTTRTTPSPTSSWKYIKWNGSLFLVVSSASTNTAATSPNGISWTAVTLPVTATWSDLQWNGTQFILTTSSSSICLTSTNGSTWTQNVTPIPISSITWNGTYWVALGSFNSIYYILFSKDGISWTQYPFFCPNANVTSFYPVSILSDGAGKCIMNRQSWNFFRSVPFLPGYKYLPTYTSANNLNYMIKAK